MMKIEMDEDKQSQGL